MPMSAGGRLGPYEIVAPLGAGGMGEVYRARDTRLDRSVAIKVLPSQFSADADRRQRFEREARAVSSLNHPHICTLYDVGEQDGTVFLVMERLEGQTLADRLEKGPLPTDQVLRFGAEIADALDNAHRQGIVHRDLKPGNVMLTKSGTKLLDFGLAKLEPPPSIGNGVEGVSALATRAKPLTSDGALLGTFQYMAPEQLQGKPADARTDIFALGSVLYEMATARRAFAAKSQASLIAEILEHEPPPMTTLQPLTPPALERVVKVCLAKDPDDRWQNARDLMRELRWIAEGGPQSGAPTIVGAPRRGGERLAWVVAGIAILAATALGIGYVRRAPSPLRQLRSTIDLPAGFEVDGWGASLALSPGGRFLALAGAGADGKRQLHLRALDGTTMQDLSGTEGATYPFWSPDAKSIAFFADGKLRRIEVAGGAVQTICEAPAGRGGTWAPDGTIVFAPAPFGSLSRVLASGGAVSDAETAVGNGESDRLPHFLPDGKRVLFLRTKPLASLYDGIYALDLTTRKVQLVAHEQSEGRYVAPGYLAFVRERNLMVQRFDAESLKVSGEAVAVAKQQRFNELRGTAQYSFEEGELLVYQMDPPTRPKQLAWLGLDGKRISTIGDPDPAAIVELSLAPDGKRAVASIDGADGTQLWMIDLAGGVRSRFSFGLKVAQSPLWSPEGKRVAFAALGTDKGAWAIQLKDADGGAPGKEVLASQDYVTPIGWSPSGQELAYNTQSSATKRWETGILPLKGDRKARSFASPANELGGTFSPDGRWFAYASDESGRYELYVRPYPGPGGKWQVSSAGADARPGNVGPFRWNGDNQILYFSPDLKAFTV
ncbi:MAG: protein kinase, partial [Vicinamibacteria bacterium]